MNTTELQRYRKLLSDVENWSKDEISRMAEYIVRDAQPAGEHDRHPGESFEAEYALEQTEEEIRRQIRAALQRIDQGTFGRCEGCGGEISKQRLDAIPYASRCIDCSRKHEST